MSCFVQATVQKPPKMFSLSSHKMKKSGIFFFLRLRMWNCEAGETIPDAPGSGIKSPINFSHGKCYMTYSSLTSVKL